MLCLFLCFFFSSRRRHTRLQGDWSSDVCSSDLNGRRSSIGSASAERKVERSVEISRSTSASADRASRSEEHTSELQSPCNLVCRLLLEKKNRHGRRAPSPRAIGSARPIRRRCLA